MRIDKIGVVGAGQMGNGIAHVAAQAGLAVRLHDVSDERVAAGLRAIDNNLQRAVDRGKLAAGDKAAVLARIDSTTELSRFADCDLVVEAIVERFETKAAVFAELDRVCRRGVILASNTSSISITKLGGCTERPAQVIGMHFMNPVPVMKLVEVIRGLATAGETTRAVVELAERMDKTAVEVADSPGFVSNRVLMPMINEAIFCLYEGVGTAESIDQVMKLGMNHPMGPLTLADFIGLDTCLAILEVLYEGFADPKYRPCPLLVKHVEAGWLGRKTGRGFYDYRS
ncbi:MAG TPA: 3-hydroxybutyryl-CoA dehydrogenase [Candidatus Polarisedimenticolaceae bacterium]|nr:3-hydroxybutyryl-CoA dehydrogenase [Candidatus Polarisedimenticolaceae bacterium]